ncbi:MAG: hypothetical protein RR313_12115 [Anaerovoracaceae bacterium]
MYQGSIGKIVNRTTGACGWYQKLRCTGDVYFINVENPNDKIRANQVNEFIRADTEKDYYVASEITGDDVVRCGNYEIDESKIVVSQQIQMAQKSLRGLKEQKQFNAIYLRSYENYKNKDIALGAKIDQLEKTLESLSNGNPIEYTYVYGKHTADTKEYCWVLPCGLSVSVGDTIEVDTSMGMKMAIVTKVEKNFEYREHKNVLRVI